MVHYCLTLGEPAASPTAYVLHSMPLALLVSLPQGLARAVPSPQIPYPLDQCLADSSLLRPLLKCHVLRAAFLCKLSSQAPSIFVAPELA